MLKADQSQYSSRVLKKCIVVSTKILRSATVFKTDNKKSWAANQHIKKISMKTGVTMLKIQLCITGTNIIKHMKYFWSNKCGLILIDQRVKVGLLNKNTQIFTQVLSCCIYTYILHSLHIKSEQVVFEVCIPLVGPLPGFHLAGKSSWVFDFHFNSDGWEKNVFLRRYYLSSVIRSSSSFVSRSCFYLATA